MRICLVSNTSIQRDPRAIAEAQSLKLVGHEVCGVGAEAASSDWITGPKPAGIRDRLRRTSTSDRITDTAAALKADLYVPTHPDALATAERASQRVNGSLVLVKPGWPRPESGDLIALAPGTPGRALPSSGVSPLMHTPSFEPIPVNPTKGRIVVAYRKTQRNPGRYVEAALERAGLDVISVDRLDWNQIGSSALGVVVVESPLPALPVIGTNSGVPVVFWAHHGEHHVDANARLQRRYGAHGVLLAHSWHLSHRFSGYVDRLPFAVAPELFEPDFKPHEQRRWEVGFVGSDSTDGRYSHRDNTLDLLSAQLGEDRLIRRSGVEPKEMARIYRDSKVVIDDGAGRHLPVTMRVFEATGAGAALLTNPGPGLEVLMEPDHQYLSLGETPLETVRVVEGDLEPIAKAGHTVTWDRHTYDHRAAEIVQAFQVVGSLDIEAPHPEESPTGLAAVVDQFADAQRVLDLGGAVREALPDREVWPYEQAEERADPRTFHMSVVSDGSYEQTRRAVEAARLGVVVPTDRADTIGTVVGEVHGPSSRHDYPSGTVFTFGRSGYRSSSEPDP